MKNYQSLDVYQRAQKLFPMVYRQVRKWRALDQKELGSQMIRAANSIHSNIAEGYGKTPNDFKRYLAIAIGSCDELTSHIHDAHHVGLIDNNEKDYLVSEYTIVGKQLTKLKQAWK
ncbi:MAG: four helix bundle protein [Parcubacteria group bacterium]|nr:four helix bundle protein [Parcubacteria group bacterium]